MEEIEKISENNKSRKFLFIGLAVILILSIIVASFMFTSKEEIKKPLSESVSDQATQKETEESELATTSPLSKPKVESKSETESAGGTSGGAGGGGGGTSGSESSSEETTFEGRLDIINSIDPSYNSQIITLSHRSGASEGSDSYDSPYTKMFDPSGISSKIVSIMDSTELDVDQRPINSTSIVYLELSLVSQSGDPITISSNNELRLSLPLTNQYFGEKTITIQQYDPNDPSAEFPIYDVRQLITNNNGILSLSNLNGTYNSEEPYAYFKLNFDYDGEIVVASAPPVEEEIINPGRLDIINSIDPSYNSQIITLSHRSGASEGSDSYDSPYTKMFDPSGISSKIVSIMDSTELDVDQRPINSTSIVYLELSLVSQSGDPITISSNNELRLSLPLESSGYDFGSKFITLQQYDPNDPSAEYPSYDVKAVINKSNGIIELPDLVGTYNSEEPYAYFKLTFNY